MLHQPVLQDRAAPVEPGGCHVLMAPPGVARRDQRHVLRAAVEAFFDARDWQSMRTPGGKRLCASRDGRPVPPISISYSGPLALVAVSPDWRSIGVDVEMAPIGRLPRYARIEQSFVGAVSDDPMACFVRAEAWAKALDYGFAFGPAFYLAGSARPGARDCGKRVDDLALGLPDDPAFHGQRVHAAVCLDLAAPTLPIRSIVRIE